MTKNLTRIPCPRCHQWNTHRNGYNLRATGEKVRRWYCQDCDRAFQQPNQDFKNKCGNF